MDCGKPMSESAVGVVAGAVAGASPGVVPPTRVHSVGGGAADIKCPSCGKAADSSLPFCAFCGGKLASASPAPVPPARKCPSCGTMVASAEYRFCPNCASPLRESVAQAAPAGTQAFVAAKVATPVGIPVSLVQVAEDGTKGEKHSLVGEETTIGRSGADIVFADDVYLSPIHALLIYKNRQLFVRDLGSRNGTWIFLTGPHRLVDGDLVLIGSQLIRFRRLGYPGPHPPEADATRRMGSLVPSADIASLAQLRSDGSVRDVLHLSPGRDVTLGRDRGDWPFPYDPSMSGSHALVRSEDADFVVQDAGSRNGVAVAARGDVQIDKGSRILVGDKLLLVEIA
jgi:pSer/pThr/pTyr-binding forkhead associated (FHA) protein/endogenous inhibitor of DNA gyrase (YacG/DUF329 family)